ncbi:hypothetical protein Rs2_03039 [Raphanus sativus]|nr:hypothetical protein Rs2_03039 [Raphanus sativus]
MASSSIYDGLLFFLFFTSSVYARFIATVVSAEETEEDCEQSYGFMALGNMFLIWFMDFSCSRQRCIYLPKVSFFSKSLPLNRRWFVSFHARSTPLRYAYYGLSGDVATAQSQVSVRMSLLAGSTFMFLTII